MSLPRRLLVPVVLLSCALSLVAGCTSAGRPESPEAQPGEAATVGVPAAERPYVVDPLEGYPLVPAPAPADEVRRAFRALALDGGTAPARAAAEQVLAADPGFHPAQVLEAQASYLEGDAAAALQRLQPVIQELPAYTAAELLAGRSAEDLGEVPRAYTAFRAVADRSSVAAERAGALEARAIEIVGNRFDDALARGRLDEAAGHLGRLEQWAPDATATLEGARKLAAAQGDQTAELAAVKKLQEAGVDRLDLETRRAELELRVGDPSEGLQRFQRLAREHPADPEIQDELERAKFRWRLTLLPPQVQAIPPETVLTRADFATLVNWLIPAVRSVRGQGGGRIATDILDHPRREEIARVVNLGLMEVDPTLHAFHPDRPIVRSQALAALLRTVQTLGGRAACLSSTPLGPRPTDDEVCLAAARCGIAPSPADCLPGATLSGSEALEMLRHTLELLSSSTP